MRRRLNKKLVTGVAVLAAALGATILIAGCGSSGSSSTSASKTGAAVTTTSTATTATTKRQKLTGGATSLHARVTGEVDRPRRTRKLAKLLASAASYLGIDAQQLHADEDLGKSLAQIADSTSGKSSAGLISALVAGRQVQITAGVKSGQITQEEGSQLTASLIKRMTARVNRRPTRLAQPKG